MVKIYASHFFVFALAYLSKKKLNESIQYYKEKQHQDNIHMNISSIKNITANVRFFLFITVKIFTMKNIGKSKNGIDDYVAMSLLI